MKHSDSGFIDHVYIEKLLANSINSSPMEFNRIIEKAKNLQGLTHKEVALLLSIDDESLLNEIFAAANYIKHKIYGDRIVLFAPLYISDYCVNNCLYCSFRNCHGYTRRRLSMDEIRREVRALEKMGHKRLALEAGEDPVNCPIDYVLDALNTIYDEKSLNGDIRRVNVNIAASSIEDYRKLRDVGIGTYILFQETYHMPTYIAVHPSGPKSDYLYHLTAFDRAQQAGIDDVGAGVLFGLFDYRFEVLALMLHTEHLEQKYGVGFHTISMPRLRPASGAAFYDTKFMPSDNEFLKLVAIIRLAVPYTGMIISTRESFEMRKKLISLGVSQISGGSSVVVGGYSCDSIIDSNLSQFNIDDERTTSEIIDWLIDEDVVPSFCTACYRTGRTGDRFMQLAKSGNIKNVCLPNALITLAEYARDYGNPLFREKVSKLISKHMLNIQNDAVLHKTASILEKIKNGERDLYL